MNDDDFRSALKELDGTFVGTQQTGGVVTVFFKNPSIRDFMQNKLLGGDGLEEILKSLTYFEQAEWFSKTLSSPNSLVPLDKLKRHANAMINCLKELVDSPPCSAYILGNTVMSYPSDSLWRFEKSIAAIAAIGGTPDEQWILTRIGVISKEIDDGVIPRSKYFTAFKLMRLNNRQESIEAERLISKIKEIALTCRSDLNDLSFISNAINDLPGEVFTESEFFAMQERFEKYTEEFADNCELSDPEEIRDELTRIEKIGFNLSANTSYAKRRLSKMADDIENDLEDSQDSNPDELRGADSASKDGSDSEIDSLFRTL